MNILVHGDIGLQGRWWGAWGGVSGDKGAGCGTEGLVWVTGGPQKSLKQWAGPMANANWVEGTKPKNHV